MKINKRLKYPLRTAIYVFAKIYSEIWAKSKKNQDTLKQSFNRFCNELGVSPDLVREKAGKVLNLDAPMESMHHYAFVALSLMKPDIGSILEFGTNKGGGTRVLAELFPNSKITTIDLDPADVKSSPMRAIVEANQNYAKKYLKDYKNIEFLYLNTIEGVRKITGNCGFIWVDADHSFPAVAWDHAIAWGCLQKGGFLLSDDLVNPAWKNWTCVRTRKTRCDAWLAFHYLANQMKTQKWGVFSKREGAYFQLFTPEYIGYIQK